MAVRTADAPAVASATVLPILLAVSAGHFLNDTMQSVLLSIYPLVKGPLALDFVQIGIITLVFQLTASVLQPAIGLYTDKRPLPFSLPFGMAATELAIGHALEWLSLPIRLKVRMDAGGHAFVTDGGHRIIDAAIGRIADPEKLSQARVAIPGVVQHGLSLGLAGTAIVAGPTGIRVIER